MVSVPGPRVRLDGIGAFKLFPQAELILAKIGEPVSAGFGGRDSANGV